MTTIDLKTIQDLRARTGFGVMDVKQALEEAAGDQGKALVILKERGAEIALKKASREQSSGRVEAYLHGDGKIGVLIEVNSETDFVAKNPEFASFVHDLALQIAAMRPSDVEQLLSQPFVKEPDKTIEEKLHELVGKIGENLSIRRFVRYELGLADESES